MAGDNNDIGRMVELQVFVDVHVDEKEKGKRRSDSMQRIV